MDELTVNSGKLNCQIDTGADTNIISIKNYMALNLDPSKIEASKSIITGLTGTHVNLMGKTTIRIMLKGKQHMLKFHVIKNNTRTLLGLQASMELDLISINKQFLNKNQFSVNNIIVNRNFWFEQYASLFKGLGCLKDTCKLALKEGVTIVVDSPRRVPFNLEEPLKAELDRLIKLGVIEPISKPTDWVNSIVLVKKANGSLRLCLDPRHLNKAMRRSHFQFPTLQNVKAKLAGSKIFSTIDANSGFWTIKLDETL